MKAYLHYLVITAVCSVVLVTGPPLLAAESPRQTPTIDQVKKKVSEASKTIRDYSVEQRDEAVQRVRKSLADLDDRIEKLEADLDGKWNEMSQASREKARESLRTFRRQRQELAEWYGGLKHSSAKAWDHVKKGFSRSFSTLEDSLEKAEEEF